MGAIERQPRGSRKETRACFPFSHATTLAHPLFRDMIGRHGPGDLARGGRVAIVHGPVERGDQRGRTIGFPTANLAMSDVVLEDGVWAGWLVRASGVRHAAAVSVGGRPTVYGRAGVRLLEAHVIDFDGDLYDEIVTVFACHRLRGQRRFNSLEALADQLRRDVALAAQWCRGAGSDSAGTVQQSDAVVGQGAGRPMGASRD